MMADAWRRFLGEQGAAIGADGAIEFINTGHEPETLITRPIACPLSGFATLEVSGQDARAFLQNQLSNDLNALAVNGSQFSAWCNPKGQVISNFIVIRRDSGYLLLCKASLKAPVQKRLGLYVLRSAVSINDRSGQLALLGIANTRLDTGRLADIEGLTAVALPAGANRYLLAGAAGAIAAALATLADKPQLAGSRLWEQLDIQAGVPWVGPETQARFLPQMLNLDLLPGLSYQKGCYPGQEVIARLHYRGKLKKRMALFKAETGLHAGGRIYQKGLNNAVGDIINATAPGQSAYALAVVQLDSLQQPLFPGPDSNQALTRLDLPYAVDA